MIIKDRPSSSFASLFEPPALKVNLKKVRHEPPDEDIRRVAIYKIRDLILQDPLATQLGNSVIGFAKRGPFFIFGWTVNSRLLQNEVFSNIAEACKFTVAFGKGAQGPRCSQSTQID